MRIQNPPRESCFLGDFSINFIMNTMPKIEKLSDVGQEILKMAIHSRATNQQNITQKAIFDILSLEPNIEKIENNQIFLKNKKRGGGKLDQKNFSKIF